MTTLVGLISHIATQIRAKERDLDTIQRDMTRLRDSLKNETDELSPAQADEIRALARRRDSVEAELDVLRDRESMYLREQDADNADHRLASTPAPVGRDRDYRGDGAGPVYGGARVSSEPGVYRRDRAETSYFKDLINARRGDLDAAERLQRNDTEVAVNHRAWDSTAPAAGGTFAPPAWLVSDFIEYSRAARVTADLLHREQLPSGVSSVNLPKIANGATVAVQVTQNTTITETTVTTTSVSSGIITIAGGQTVSVQQIEQSATPIDEVVLSDLAAAYAMALDGQVLNGSGEDGQLRGILTVTAGTTISYTTTTPLVVSATAATNFYGKVLAAISNVNTTRFAPPTAIVMHPRRWTWILGGLDGENRPLVVPGPNVNAAGSGQSAVAQGAAGMFAGLPVYIDPSVPTNLGTGTNQDVVIITRSEDLWLWESAPRLQSFDATLADQASVYFRALGFAALIADRLPAALALVSGTGLTTPA